MDKYLIQTSKTPPNSLKSWNDLNASNIRRSLSLSQSAKKKSSSSQSKKRYSTILDTAGGDCNRKYSTLNSRDVLIKKYFAGANVGANINASVYDVSSKSLLSSTKINHSEMSLLADDIENISPASPLARTLSQLTMDNSPKETGNINYNAVTPKQNPCFDKIKRDLNSPSAAVRLRALHALKSPSKIQNYYGYDVPTEEIDIITEEERKSPEKPKSIQEIMNDVIVYVEVRHGFDNRSAGIKNIMHTLGAKVNDKLLRNTTHVIFKDGLRSTYNKAKRWNIPLVSILWVEACKKFKKLMPTKYYPISDLENYENPDMKKIRKYKSMQPDVDDIIKTNSKMMPNNNIDKICEGDSAEDSSDDDVFETKSPKVLNRQNILVDSIKSCDSMIKSISQNLQHLSQKGDESSGICVLDASQSTSDQTVTDGSTRMDIELNLNVTMRRSNRNSLMCSSIITKDCSTPIQSNDGNTKVTKRLTTFAETMDISNPSSSYLENKSNYAVRTMEESKSATKNPTLSANRRRTLYTPKYNEETDNHHDCNSKIVPDSPYRSAEQNKNHRRTTIGLSRRPTPKSNLFNPHMDISIEQQLDETKTKNVDETPPAIPTSSVKRRRTLYNPNSYSVEHNLTNDDTMRNEQIDSESKKIKEQELSKLIAERKKLRRSLFPLSTSTSANTVEDKSNSPGPGSIDKDMTEKNAINQTQGTTASTAEEIHEAPPPSSTLTLPPTGAVKKRKLFTSGGAFINLPTPDKTIHKPLVPTPQKATVVTPILKTKSSKSRRSTMDFETIKPKIQTPAKSTSTSSVRKIFIGNQQREQILVVTNMHKSQIDVVKETIKTLGRFKLEQTVTDRTTHLVSFEPRRTINMLRGIIRGVWILNYDWILDSTNTGKWLHEEFYEMKDFSKAVQLCRTERQAFEGNYKIDVFQDTDPIYISPKSIIPVHNLRELIRSCSGRVTDNIKEARFVLGEKLSDENIFCLNPLWILDSIQNNKIMKISKYVLRYNDEK